MPIRAENRTRYPADWDAISRRIRFERAGGQCECVGECRKGHTTRCSARRLGPHPLTGALVILTVAHLPGREIEQCGDGDLKAMCQRCHNAMDAPMRRRGIWQRARALFASGDLFGERATQENGDG